MQYFKYKYALISNENNSNTLHAPLSFHRFSLTDSILTQEAAEIETNSHAIVVLDFVIPQVLKLCFI